MRREYLISFLLGVVTLAVYWPITSALFVDYDDNMYIIQNAHVQAGLNSENVAWAFKTGYAANWHPLTWISHMLDCQFYGMDAGKHHLTNLLFHVTNTLLLFSLLRLMTGTFWRSALVAALFAWHPAHVESVAWIAERKDVLSTFFGLLTMLAYVKYVKESKVQAPKSKAYYGLALLCFALGLMSKPMLVTLPFVLLLLDYWPLRRINEPNDLKVIPPTSPVIRKLIWEKAPFLVLSIASCVVTYCVQKTGGASSLHQLSPGMRIAVALVSYASYLGKVFWPTHLAVLYPFIPSFPLWQIMAAALALLGITVWAVRMSMRRPYLLVGWLWFLGMLVPVIGFVQIGETSMADRYLYVPAVGIFIGIAWYLAELTGAWTVAIRRGVLGSLAGLALAGCIVGTSLQVGYWHDSVALFQHALAVTTDNPVAAFDLAQILSSAGRVKEAMPYYAEELRIKPDDDRAYNNLGLCLAMQGKFAEATNFYAQSLLHNPKKADAASTHFNYSLALTALGDLDAAIVHNLESLRLEPNHPQEQCAVGLLLLDKGRFDEAKAHLSEAVKLQPDYVLAYFNLGKVLLKQGHMDEAAVQFQETVRLDPDNAVAHQNLGDIFAKQGKVEEAAQHHQEALRLDPNSPH